MRRQGNTETWANTWSHGAGETLMYLGYGHEGISYVWRTYTWMSHYQRCLPGLCLPALLVPGLFGVCSSQRLQQRVLLSRRPRASQRV